MRIEGSGICCVAGGKAVLDAVDITLGPGGMTGLIGPNGAGKTTLLRVLTGLAAPWAGTVRYDGEAAHALGRDIARRVAFLAQGGEVNWALRVDELVALGRLPHRRFGAPGPADLRAVERALEAADAGAFRDRTMSTLSGGERMRVLLARAMAVEAAILLADEPVTALDPYHQIRVMEVLRAEADAGAGIVVVLHDLTLAHRFCDRLVLMHEGRIMADGVPDAVLSDERVRHAYGVDLVRGVSPGGAFVLPWSRISHPVHDPVLSERMP